MNTMTSEEIRIAELAVSLVRQDIRVRMSRLPYCDHGFNAYDHAQEAVEQGFAAINELFAKMRKEIGA